jgi:hypothetical protein
LSCGESVFRVESSGKWFGSIIGIGRADHRRRLALPLSALQTARNR